MSVTAAEKRVRFRRLHEDGCFLLPNPWDVGSARVLQGLGFQALATTSSGFAWTLGKRDYGVTVDEVVAHLAALSAATDLPVNADFEGGFSDTPDGVAANVRKAVDAGVAGLSIEDMASGPGNPLYEEAVAVERLRAARAAIDASAPAGERALLVGRTEGFHLGHLDLSGVVKRLTAYAEAGADCLYPVGVAEAGDIAQIVQAVAPLPVNILARPGHTLAGLAELGVRRISVGGSFARVALSALADAARALQADDFASLGQGLSGKEINALMVAGPA